MGSASRAPLLVPEPDPTSLQTKPLYPYMSCPFSIQTIPVSFIFHCFWHLSAQCDLISMLQSSGQGWKDSAGFSVMALVVICPALCDNEICSYWQGMHFFRGTFGPLIFTFCSSKTLSRATQLLVSHWAQSWDSYRTAQITAFWEVTKAADTSSMSDVGFLTATCWTEKKAYLRFQNSLSFLLFPRPL